MARGGNRDLSGACLRERVEPDLVGQAAGQVRARALFYLTQRRKDAKGPAKRSGHSKESSRRRPGPMNSEIGSLAATLSLHFRNTVCMGPGRRRDDSESKQDACRPPAGAQLPDGAGCGGGVMAAIAAWRSASLIVPL
jgi:hypothetical protein